jgi:hypothetical protein
MRLGTAAFVFVTGMLVMNLTVNADKKAAAADDKAAAGASQRFEALKGLAGDWVEIGTDGKPTDKVVTSFRVTSGGNTIQETLFPGSPKEMITMYHLDGADLVLTHYCVLGNQPRLKAEPGDDVNKIVFKFAGATNLKSGDDHHMDHATLTLGGKNRFKAEWVSCKEGKTCHQVSFELARKQ